MDNKKLLADGHNESARDLRIAHNDCHETHLTKSKAKAHSLSDEEVDRKCILSGRYFRRCYWRDYDPELRKKIIHLKLMHCWTEWELFHVLIIGALRVNRLTGEVKAVADKNVYRLGWVLFGFIRLYIVEQVFSIQLSDNPLQMKQAAMLGMLFIWFLAAYLINFFFFKPYELMIRPFVRGETC